MRPVLTKVDFVRRYREGEFGNASPTWDSLDDVPLGKIRDESTLFHVRGKEVGGITFYNVTGEFLSNVWYNAIDNCGGDFYISEMAPTERTLIQGEFCENPELYLRYTRVRLPMRDALVSSQEHVTGLGARLLLKSYLDGRSYEHVMELLDRYPKHVVEFSTYGVDWGTIPGLNTVIWEVRLY